jgi:hypothetical protein
LKNLPRKGFIQFSNLTSSQSVFITSQQLLIISKLIERHITTFEDSTDEQYIPIYQIISKDDIESAGLTEFELRSLRSCQKRTSTITKVEKELIDKLLIWYQQEKFPIRRARFIYEKKDYYLFDQIFKFFVLFITLF